MSTVLFVFLFFLLSLLSRFLLLRLHSDTSSNLSVHCLVFHCFCPVSKMLFACTSTFQHSFHPLNRAFIALKSRVQPHGWGRGCGQRRPEGKETVYRKEVRRVLRLGHFMTLLRFQLPTQTDIVKTQNESELQPAKRNQPGNVILVSQCLAPPEATSGAPSSPHGQMGNLLWTNCENNPAEKGRLSSHNQKP